jgi:hypothetical protein
MLLVADDLENFLPGTLLPFRVHGQHEHDVERGVGDGVLACEVEELAVVEHRSEVELYSVFVPPLRCSFQHAPQEVVTIGACFPAAHRIYPAVDQLKQQRFHFVRHLVHVPVLLRRYVSAQTFVSER